MNEKAREFRAMRRVTLPKDVVQARENKEKRLNEIIKNNQKRMKEISDNYREITRKIKNICKWSRKKSIKRKEEKNHGNETF